MSRLILLRHGQSTWNAQNRFTGWVDVPLSDPGEQEARTAGKRLAAAGISVDVVFTSALRRAIDTARIVLEVLGQTDLPATEAWQLNERFYGALTGRDKAQTAAEFGAEQVRVWRRSFDIAPPGGESLQDTAARAYPYFRDTVLAAARAQQVVLVSAHGNSLRAIARELDGLSEEEVVGLEIATGVPIVYELDDGRPVGKQILS